LQSLQHQCSPELLGSSTPTRQSNRGTPASFLQSSQDQCSQDLLASPTPNRHRNQRTPADKTPENQATSKSPESDETTRASDSASSIVDFLLFNSNANADTAGWTNLNESDDNASPSGGKPTTEDEGTQSESVDETLDASKPIRVTRRVMKRTAALGEADSTEDAERSTEKRFRRTPQSAAVSSLLSKSPTEGSDFEEGNSIRILATRVNLDSTQKDVSRTVRPLFQF
jgi:hypothetical protein